MISLRKKSGRCGIGADKRRGVIGSAFAGLARPTGISTREVWIIGLTRGTTAGHIGEGRAEGIAYQVADTGRCNAGGQRCPADRDAGDGGASKNNLLMQLQADILGTRCTGGGDGDDGSWRAYLSGLAVAFGKNERGVGTMACGGRFDRRCLAPKPDACASVGTRR